MTNDVPTIRLMSWNINKLSGARQGGPRSSAAVAGIKKVIGDFFAQETSAILALQELSADNDPAGDFMGWLGSLAGCGVSAGSENRCCRTVVVCKGVRAELAACNHSLSRANRYVALTLDAGGRRLRLLALHANAGGGGGEIADDDIVARLCECGTWVDEAPLVLAGDTNAAPGYRERLTRDLGLADAFADKATTIWGTSPDTVMGRDVTMDDAGVHRCGWSDHYPITCAVRL